MLTYTNRVECRAITAVAPTYALLLTKPEQIELAPFSLTKPKQVLSQRKNCEQQTQAPVPSNTPASSGTVSVFDCARMGGSAIQNCSNKPEYQKTRAKQRANPAVRTNPIGSAVAVDESPQRAATHLARYRDCARLARRYHRLHDEPSPPEA